MKSIKLLFKKLCKVNLRSSLSDAGCIAASLLFFFLLWRLIPSDPDVVWVKDNLIFISVLVIFAYVIPIGIYSFFKNQILKYEYKINISYKSLFLKNLGLISFLILIYLFFAAMLSTPFLGLFFAILALLVAITLPLLVQLTHARTFSKAISSVVKNPLLVLKTTGIMLAAILILYIVMVLSQQFILFLLGVEVGHFAYYAYMSGFGVYSALSYLFILQITRRYVLLHRNKV